MKSRCRKLVYKDVDNKLKKENSNLEKSLENIASGLLFLIFELQAFSTNIYLLHLRGAAIASRLLFLDMLLAWKLGSYCAIKLKVYEMQRLRTWLNQPSLFLCWTLYAVTYAVKFALIFTSDFENFREKCTEIICSSDFVQMTVEGSGYIFILWLLMCHLSGSTRVRAHCVDLLFFMAVLFIDDVFNLVSFIFPGNEAHLCTDEMIALSETLLWLPLLTFTLLSIGTAFVCCLSDAGAERVEKLLGSNNVHRWIGVTFFLVSFLCRLNILKMLQHILAILRDPLAVEFF